MIKRLLILVLAIGLGLAGAGWVVHHRLTTPYAAFSGPEVFVELPPGSGVSSIANRLVAAGVIPDAISFRVAARLTGADRRLQAGEYRFAGPSTPLAVMERLSAGDVYTHPVTFREGLTIFEMADAFARSGLGTADDFLTAARDRTLVEARDPRAHSLEGFLFPDTYSLPRSGRAEDLVKQMLARFDKVYDAALQAEAERRGMSTRDVLTLASIVEKETGRAEERSKVAAVYHNRLKIGMPLQCDPTVIYALMLNGRWNGNLRKADLQMNSPYNTYVVRGLPPGPIASPGRASIEAALRPADVDYLYFVSRNDGSHVFATTLAEHNRNVAQWQIRFFRNNR